MTLQDPVVAALLRDVVGPILLGMFLSAGAWIVSKMPGPIKDALYSATHARDVKLLSDALSNRAKAETVNPATPPPSTDDLIRYAEAVLPGLLAKMALPQVSLETMAAASIAKAEAELSPVAVIEKVATP